jgi:hypothetical protein
VLSRLLASPSRRIVGAILAVFTVLAVWAVVDLLLIQRDITSGEHGLKSADAAAMARPRGIARVAEAAASKFQNADRRARKGLPLRVVSPIPVLGQQVKVLRSMTRTATQVGAIGTVAARQVQARLDVATQGPPGRVALLTTAVEELDRARAKLHGLKVGDDKWALPPLRGARAHLAASLTTAQTKMQDASVMADALRRMFVGPSRYLILAGNNAEMRTGGMPLSAGVAEIRDGAIAVGAFMSTYDLFLLHGAVPVPKNVQDLYGWMTIGAEWRATTATPNFPLSGELYSEMAQRAGLGPVDGVIFVDILALKAVITATGPVDLDGVRYTTANIEQQVMNENYINFGDPLAQSGRRDLQSRLGTAVFEALNSRPLKLGPLVSNLSTAGKGRHLLAWSADPGLQAAFQRTAIDGALHPDALMVNLENISANKLDWYITPKINLKTVWVRRGVRRVEMSVTFTNKRRTRTSDVVEGVVYDRTHGMQDGEHRVFFVAYLPKSAVDVASANPPFSSAGVDGPMKVVGFNYGVKIGETRTVKVTFSVPKNQVFLLIPSARAHPVTVTTPKGVFTDALPVALVM